MLVSLEKRHWLVSNGSSAILQFGYSSNARTKQSIPSFSLAKKPSSQIGSLRRGVETSTEHFGYPHPILPLLVRLAVSRRPRDGEGVGKAIDAIDAATIVVAREVGGPEDQGFAVRGIRVAEPGVAVRWRGEDLCAEEEMDEGEVEGAHAAKFCVSSCIVQIVH